MFRSLLFVVLSVFIFTVPLAAQDDVTTQNASSAAGGAFITGPASNPLSFLNGPAYRTFGSVEPYDFRNFDPASLLNRHLPKWIGFGAEERLRYENNHDANFKSGSDDGYSLNRFRYQMDLQPTNWLKIVSQVQDARPISENPPIGPPNENTWDLKLAYVQAGDPEKQWFSVRAGRQLINYNNTIIANSEWRDQGRSYDAVAGNLHYRRYRLGLFAASAVITRDFGISRHEKGNDVYGAYGYVNDVFSGAVLEPFVLWRTQPSVALEAAASRNGKQNERAYGVRLKGKAKGMLDYSAEAIAERGSDGPNAIHAWASTIGVAYRFESLRGQPRLFTQYDFAAGDSHSTDGIHGTFDTMYPTAHDRFGITDQFGWQNISASRGGITVEPHHRWTLTAQYINFSLATASDGLYNTSGGLIVRDATGRSGTHIGEECDVYSWYELNGHVNVGAGVGHLMPGSFLAHTTSGPNFNYSYFAVNFKDNGKNRF
ncbi:MAG TPA: alginate export family protein [Terriglobia bacterium]|jgi:hypothetical protein